MLVVGYWLIVVLLSTINYRLTSSPKLNYPQFWRCKLLAVLWLVFFVLYRQRYKEEGKEFSLPQFGFNVMVGGFFSAKRCDAAIPLNAWVPPEDVVAVCRAILEVYRDRGLRANRQKSRLMWLIDELGLDKFRS